MKKFWSLSVIAFIAITYVSAQSVKEAAFDYDKKPVKGFTLAMYDKSADVVTAAVKDRMEKGAGLKPSKGKDGFTVYLNQLLPAFGVANANIYVKIADEGKRDSKVTMMYLYVTTLDYANVNSENNPDMYAKIMQYMNEMSAYINRYDTEQNLIKAQNAYDKVKSNLEKLNNKLTDLNNDKAKLEKQLSDKEQEIKKKSVEIEHAREEVTKAEEAVNKYKSELQ
jgi:vacuolar-type H+-ATPase catalytic subunit A/Vma1